MSTIGSYPTKSFSETQKFLVLDPASGTTSLVSGSSIKEAIQLGEQAVIAVSTTDVLLTESYEVGQIIQTSGGSLPGDGGNGTFVIQPAGSGGTPIFNGNEAVLLPFGSLAGSDVSESVVDSSTGLGQAVTDAFNDRVIQVESIAEGFAGLSGTASYQYSVAGWRDDRPQGGGAFVYLSGVAKSLHNGGTIISPTVPAVSAQTGTDIHERISNFCAGTGETDGAGTGIFWRIADNKDEVLSDWFGAPDNTGTEEVGYELAAFVNYINSITTGYKVKAVFSPGTYLITGGRDLGIGSGVSEGLEPFLRDDVEIRLDGVELKVPDAFRYERTGSGGDANDHFAEGLWVQGSNCTVVGGVLNGNLRNRTINRGPSQTGYGGQEYGYLNTGTNNKIIGLTTKEWGTDSGRCNAGSTQYFMCNFLAGRRLSFSAISSASTPADTTNPREFYDCLFAEAATYGDDDFNRPGAGFDIEGNTAGVPSTTHFYNCTFRDNRTYCIYLSLGAKDCIFQGCHFYGATTTWSIGTIETSFEGINKQPSADGGHLWNDCYFHGEVALGNIYGDSAEDPSTLTGNHFESTVGIINFRSAADYPNGWIIVNNSCPALTVDAFIPNNGTDHIVGGNIGKETIRQNYVIDGNLAIGGSDVIDLATLATNGDIDGDSTYEIICKMNNGNGIFDGYSRYIVAMVGDAVDGALIIEEVANNTRSFTYSSGQITASSVNFASDYGLLFNRIGTGQFGT